MTTMLGNSIPIQQTTLGGSTLHINGLGSNITFEMRRTRAQSLPSIRLRHVARKSFALEYFYKITDVVLLLCGIVFVLSSVAYTILWIYPVVKYRVMGATNKFDISIPKSPNLNDLGPEKLAR